ncbi:MAG: hypothetical protein ACRDEA_22810, partial [Microcystaceae cyanobacterium]
SRITKVETTNRPILIRAHQAAASTLDKAPEMETLLSPDQMRHHGIKVHDLAHIYNGSQCFVIPQKNDKDIIVPLTYNGNYTLYHTYPTYDDLKNLPIYDITSDEEWRPTDNPNMEFDISKYTANRRQKKSKKGMYTRKALQRWADQLYCPDLNVVKKTLNATTQLAQVEPPSSLAHLKQHEKRRLYEFKHKRIADEVFVDIMQTKSGEKSIRGYKYAAVFVCKRSHFTKVYPLKTRDHSIDALRNFLTDVGSPTKLCYDRAGEFVLDEEFQDELRRSKIKTWTSEAYHQHQKIGQNLVLEMLKPRFIKF